MLDESKSRAKKGEHRTHRLRRNKRETKRKARNREIKQSKKEGVEGFFIFPKRRIKRIQEEAR